MEQNIQKAQKALRENYLPVWQNQLGVTPSALLQKIKQIPLVSNKITAVAPIGLSGGFGFSAEGDATPTSGGITYQDFHATAKDIYAEIQISEKAVRLGSGSGAMVNLLDAEMKGAYEAAKWGFGRALFGNGTGKLTNFLPLGVAGNTINVQDTRNLKEGMTIDLYATGQTTPQTNGAARRILSIDRTAKTVTLAGDPSTFSGGFITTQKSFNREITGLGAIFDDDITTIWGVSKTENPFIKPIVIDADGDINDKIITQALRAAKADKNSDVDFIMAGNDAYDAYVDFLHTNNVRVEEDTHTLLGGFQAISFLHGSKEVEIVNEPFLPNTDMWGVETGNLELHMDKWDFAELQGGSIFNLMESKSVYRALLASYGELICKNPGGCIRLTNCC